MKDYHGGELKWDKVFVCASCLKSSNFMGARMSMNKDQIVHFCSTTCSDFYLKPIRMLKGKRV